MANLFERLGRPPPAEARSIQPQDELLPAQKLLDWLQHWTKPTISLRDIHAYGPNSLRDKKSAVRSIEVLVHFGWLSPNRSHRYDRRVWEIVRKPIVRPTVATKTPVTGP